MTTDSSHAMRPTRERRFWLGIALMVLAICLLLLIYGCLFSADPTPLPSADPAQTTGPLQIQNGPVTFERWQAVNFKLTSADAQEYANWDVAADADSVIQTINADPSLFVSSRILYDMTIKGSWRVRGSSDDDYIGFVFGYQDPGHFYIFDWKSRDQDVAEHGMNVRVVSTEYEGPEQGNLPAGNPFSHREFWNTNGDGEKVRLLDHQRVDGWRHGVEYTFQLETRTDGFRIVVRQGGTVLYDETHEDDTYPMGRFGFYNYSQSDVQYERFHATKEVLQP